MEKLLRDLVKVRLKKPDDFLVIKETLTRVGSVLGNAKTLIQECHILHKKGEYYIVHYNQLKELDGEKTDFSADDHGKLNTIVVLLEDWGLIEVNDPKKTRFPRAGLTSIRILSHNEKRDWALESRYAIGVKRG